MNEKRAHEREDEGKGASRTAPLGEEIAVLLVRAGTGLAADRRSVVTGFKLLTSAQGKQDEDD